MKRKKLNAIILEDDLYFSSILAQRLSKFCNVTQSATLKEFNEKIQISNFDISFIDLNLSSNKNKKEGFKAITTSINFDIVPIVITGNEDKETITHSFELGCSQYISKLNFEKEYENIIKCIFSSFNDDFNEVFKNDFITNSNSLKTKISYSIKQSYYNQNFFLSGPTGTGKSKLAKIIHNKTNKDAPFISVNLSEIPENLIESELFGHKKGAFTGAINDHIGFIERANGGTLFIDEIGTLSIQIQKKLLKTLEDKSIHPIGSKYSKTVNFRLITATCDDINELINNKDFRIDLYFRLKGVEIDIPPLKQRRCDIIPLIDFFIRKSSKKIAFDQKAEEYLKNYDWFGNTRELQNFINEYINKSKGIIKSKDLPTYIIKNIKPYINLSQEENSFTKNLLNNEMKNIIKKNGLPNLINLIEQEAMREWQERHKGKTNEIIRQLQISKSLYYRIQKDLSFSKASSKEFTLNSEVT